MPFTNEKNRRMSYPMWYIVQLKQEDKHTTMNNQAEPYNARTNLTKTIEGNNT